ncbi:MAG TPA: alpha/beta hydrolase [Chlamydiales bacterium]|nr:alpha/beta hydrolase [Chlamydiales bacterium]
MKVIPLLIALSTLFATERFESGPLVGYSDLPKHQVFSIAILLQGAQRESARGLHEALKGEILPLHMGVVTLEKGKETEPLQRIEDHLLLFSQLKKLFPGWNGKLALIGQGEGGRVAAALAAKQNDLLALILISAGGGWNPRDELLISFKNEMAASGFSPQYIHSFLVQARAQFENATLKPSSKHDCFGFSYKYWDALMKSDLIGDLSKLNCPIYYMHGDLDDRIPIESVNFLVKAMKEKPNLTVHRYPKAGREIIQDPDTYHKALAWLQRVI